MGRQDARNTMPLSNNVFPSSSAFERHFYQDLADTDEVATNICTKNKQAHSSISTVIPNWNKDWSKMKTKVITEGYISYLFSLSSTGVHIISILDINQKCTVFFSQQMHPSMHYD